MIIASALDPRVKNRLPMCGITVESMKTHVMNAFEARYAEEWGRMQAYASDDGVDDPDSNCQEVNGNNFFDALNVDSGVDNDPSRDQGELFEAELDRWISQASMDIRQSSHDVCSWFQVSASGYPRIQMMAKEYLAVTATSVPSECAFSSAGTTISKRRARLGDDSVQALQELESWNRFLKSVGIE